MLSKKMIHTLLHCHTYYCRADGRTALALHRRGLVRFHHGKPRFTFSLTKSGRETRNALAVVRPAVLKKILET